jgi:hypothetical protein
MVLVKDGERVVTPSEIMAYKMPEIAIGESVIWYPSGRLTDRNARPGIVHRVNFGSISIWVVGANIRESVKHASDPRLERSGEQRESGCWDFSPAVLKLAELELRIQQIEQQLTDEPQHDEVSTASKAAGANQMWELRHACRDRGHPAWKSLTIADAREWLNNALKTEG